MVFRENGICFTNRRTAFAKAEVLGPSGWYAGDVIDRQYWSFGARKAKPEVILLGIMLFWLLIKKISSIGTRNVFAIRPSPFAIHL